MSGTSDPDTPLGRLASEVPGRAAQAVTPRRGMTPKFWKVIYRWNVVPSTKNWIQRREARELGNINRIGTD